MENKDLEKMADLIKDIKVAMLTTTDDEGELRSRPMHTQEIKEDGVLYFFTEEDSPKVHELDSHKKVNISYMDRDDQIYVSVSGNATHIKDKNKIYELWTPYLKAWFPKGKDDPNICLLRVEITKAEYWDTPGNRMVQLVGMAKAAVSGEQYKPGENKKIHM
jgi:general stress protein 26